MNLTMETPRDILTGKIHILGHEDYTGPKFAVLEIVHRRRAIPAAATSGKATSHGIAKNKSS